MECPCEFVPWTGIKGKEIQIDGTINIPRKGTVPHPLDPRIKTRAAVTVRKDVRLVSPLRRFPVPIPLDRIRVPSRDPRLDARRPVGTPSMERMFRRQQLEVRARENTVPDIIKSMDGPIHFAH